MTSKALEMTDTKDDEKPVAKGDVQPGVRGAILGLLLGGLTMLVLSISCYLGAQPEEALYVDADRSEGLSREACGQKGLMLVNEIACRPAGEIDFYLVEDYSLSNETSSFETFTAAFEQFYMEDADRIACLGFSETLLPASVIPDPNYGRGCARRRQFVSKLRRESPGLFERTNFETLFRALGDRLGAERLNDEPAYLPGQSHQDLVIILSDGLDDPVNQPTNCGVVPLSPISRGVESALRDLHMNLVTHEDEVWLFVVLVGYPQVCGADLENRWQAMRSYGLNVILAGDPPDPRRVSKMIFDTISDSQVQLSSIGLESPTVSRRELEKSGSFALRYRISKIEPARARTIRNPKIPILRAALVAESGDRISLSAWNGAEEFDQLEATFVDWRRDYVDLQFQVAPSEEAIDPRENYRLELYLGGSARAIAVDLPRRWHAELRAKLGNVKIAVLFGLIVSVFLANVRRPWLWTRPSGGETGSGTTGTNPPSEWVSGLAVLLFVLSVCNFVTDPLFLPDLHVAVATFSLVAVVSLQSRHNLLVECFLAVLVPLKVSASNLFGS